MPELPHAARESSHDSFDSSKHVNWLINGAGLGAYAHGRIHQEGPFGIYVGDLIHKRGLLATDDVLKMEEQAKDSMGDPLSARSSLGNLIALVLMPNMSTSNGEGDIIAYYEGGVVAFDTFKSPRETRIDGTGEVLQKGWDFQRLVSHLLDSISAVGRNAVAVLPRDHFFRSSFGLHFLKTVLGDGTFNPEHLNTISQDIQPLLNFDRPENLLGAATGNWIKGHRLFASTGLHSSPEHSAEPLAKGFISLNQAVTFSDDRTPKFAAEGVWVLDHGMQGLHQFVNLGLRPESGSFGFTASDRDTDLYFATIGNDLEEDYRDGDWLPIEWSCETGCFQVANDGQRKKLSEGILKGIFSQCSGRVRVLVRTDEKNEWAIWHEFDPCEKSKDAGQKFLRTEPLGMPPLTHREANWFQFRIEGLGYMENLDLRYAIGDAGSNSGHSRCIAVGSCETDPFIINNEPTSARWNT